MSDYRYYWVDVFAEARFGGNPLVVFPEAEGLSSELMQQLAREFNLSETTFVTSVAAEGAARPDFDVRIFTPGREIPFAGHPTLGTAWVLRQHFGLKTGKLSLHEGVGQVPVCFLAAEGGREVLELETAVAPEYAPLPLSKAELADFLGLQASEIGIDGLEPEIVSCGLPYALVPIRSLAAIQRARYIWSQDHPLLRRDPALREVYLFCPETVLPGRDFHVRMFAPGVGVPEDPATGSAAATLAAYLMRHMQEGAEGPWQLEQGLELGRPSLLQIRAQAGRIFVAGQVHLLGQGEIEV